MAKRLFVLLIVLMVLATLSVITLTLTGHEDLVIAAFRWVTSSATTVAVLVAVVVAILAALP